MEDIEKYRKFKEDVKTDIYGTIGEFGLGISLFAKIMTYGLLILLTFGKNDIIPSGIRIILGILLFIFTTFFIVSKNFREQSFRIWTIIFIVICGLCFIIPTGYIAIVMMKEFLKYFI